MTRDLTNPSRPARSFVKSILGLYVKDMINDGDYVRLEKELCDVIRAERGLVLRLTRPRATPPPLKEPRTEP